MNVILKMFIVKKKVKKKEICSLEKTVSDDHIKDLGHNFFFF